MSTMVLTAEDGSTLELKATERVPFRLSRLPKLRWGLLTVTSYEGRRGNEPLYRCTCDCGAEVLRTEPELKTKKHCSCPTCRTEYVSERIEQKAKSKKTHHAYY